MRRHPGPRRSGLSHAGWHLHPGPVRGERSGSAGLLERRGAYPECHTPEGVYDLLGNLWEWTDPGLRNPEGRPVIDKRGAAHYSAEPQGCSYHSIGSHEPAFDGTIGFRCCAPPTQVTP